MSLELNKVISFNYVLKDEEGTVLDTTENKAPLTFLSGKNQILPKLEEAFDGMLIGGKKNVKIDAANAYGEYDEKAVQNLKKEQFPADAKLETGMRYVANSPEGGQIPFVITEVKENDIKADFNHPLAGKDLEFDVELIDVRDATAEEMQHGHVHGPDGHNH
jgi:FKBP-type peptidyl-prolyl cis-trans isomerase SlyD